MAATIPSQVIVAFLFVMSNGNIGSTATTTTTTMMTTTRTAITIASHQRATITAHTD